ncbi:protein PHYTOCHROME KINASE SUBSTRATE 2 [Typha angustifolia]|uniref:protein PHYTOCHROME KINASE SUBSTRATE 2 n=1 Tax=Typha angustifolia TaxID=59011 RepID=UPI003C3034CB
MASVRVDTTRDDSFSSYLAIMRDNLSSEHGGSVASRSSCPISLSRRRPNDGEIDIFSAEKYFSGGMDEMKTAREIRPPAPATRDVKTKSRTVSTSSEVSGNSRRVLLRQRLGEQPIIDRRRQSNSKKFLGVFKCSCNGKQAVDTGGEEGEGGVGLDGRLSEHKEKIGLEKELRVERFGIGLREGMLSFPPNWNSMAGKVTVGRETLLTSINEVDRGRDDDDDDLRSESSSDLFEIESLSIKSHPFFKREAMESSAMTYYEPSEASIEWSVVTASAANFSVASECGDRTVDESKKAKQQRSGLLMGCASHKAVDVAADMHNKPLDKDIYQRLHVAPAMRYRIQAGPVLYKP